MFSSRWGALARGLVTAAAALALGGALLYSTRSGLDGIAAAAWLLTVLLAAAVATLRLDRRESARLRRDFATELSHEVRTSVAHIRTFNEMLLLGRDGSEEERQRWLEVIDRESYRLGDRAENLLLLAHPPEQLTFPARRSTDLGALLEDAAAFFAPDAAARQMQIVTRVPGGVRALVEPSAVRLALVNLIDDALRKSREAQTITLSLRLDAGEAVIAVADAGRELAPDDRRRVWQPFAQRTGGGSSEQGGSLGLAVVRRVAEAHGGRAYVEDVPSGGVRFCMVLPTMSPAKPIPSPSLVAGSHPL